MKEWFISMYKTCKPTGAIISLGIWSYDGDWWLMVTG
jgi:hypothetical protein